MGGHLPIGAGYPLPRLGEVVRDAEHLGEQLLAVLSRQWDPTSGPQQQDVGDPSTVDESLGAAAALIHVALLHIGDVAEVAGLPPAGSAVAVHFPTPGAAVAGDGRASGLDPAGAPVPAAVGSPGGSRPPGQTRPLYDRCSDRSEPSHLRRSRPYFCPTCSEETFGPATDPETGAPTVLVTAAINAALDNRSR